MNFNVGPTTIAPSTTKDSFQSGFAAFTKLEAYYLSESEFNSAKSSTYSKIVSISNEEEDEAAGNSGFDSAAGSPTDAIKTGLANLQNYKGVYSDSYRVSLPVAGESEEVQETKRQINNHSNAGLVNKEYFKDYNVNSDWYKGLQSFAGTSVTDSDALWDSIFGDATQPLLIWNKANRANLAYGFIGNSTTIAANTYSAISVRVKASAGATASVYLIDMNDTDRQTTLSIGGDLIYWYDEDGNICTKDPAEKSSVVAFKLDGKTGLYTANKNWSGYATLSDAQKSGYFANLTNYEKDPVTGNLYVAEGGAEHSYNDYTWNREAFYGKDGKYYADKDYKTLVYNLADVSALEPRYAATEKQDLSFVVTGNGEWQTVTFYVHTGDLAKNYRLEVWSGTRNGDKVNEENSYVIFDTNSPIDSTNTAEKNFKSYTDLVASNDAAVKSSFESVFSYFDSAAFLRYSATLDVDKVGNLYENSYTYADQTSGVAYMLYEEGNYFVKVADYALSEKTVTAETVEDEETSSSESSVEEESGVNLWMLISSIAVAAVLVIVIVSIVIQKLVKKSRKSKGAKARVTNVTKSVAKKTEKKVEKSEEKEDDSPYND